jgi:hypothetical protein
MVGGVVQVKFIFPEFVGIGRRRMAMTAGGDDGTMTGTTDNGVTVRRVAVSSDRWPKLASKDNGFKIHPSPSGKPYTALQRFNFEGNGFFLQSETLLILRTRLAIGLGCATCVWTDISARVTQIPSGWT